jgi:hypothetical protein
MNLVVILVPAVSDGNKEISDIVENNNVFYKRIQDAWYFRTNLFGADHVVNIISKSKDQVRK